MDVFQPDREIEGIRQYFKTRDLPKRVSHRVSGSCRRHPLIMTIFVNILLDKGIITSEIFGVQLLMAIAPMLTVRMVSPEPKRMKKIIFRSM